MRKSYFYGISAIADTATAAARLPSFLSPQLVAAVLHSIGAVPPDPPPIIGPFPGECCLFGLCAESMFPPRNVLRREGGRVIGYANQIVFLHIISAYCTRQFQKYRSTRYHYSTAPKIWTHKRQKKKKPSLRGCLISSRHRAKPVLIQQVTNKTTAT